MKYLRTFDTKRDYKAAKKSHSLDLPNVSYIKKDGSTYITPAITNKYNAEAGDILCYTKESYDKWQDAAAGDAKTAAFNEMYASIKYIKPKAYTGEIASTYIADGIVAVPYLHTDDNTVRVMSLKYMDTAAPESGTLTATNIVWGAFVDIQGIKNHTGGVYLSDTDLGDISGLKSTYPVYLPSDKFNGKEVIGTDSEYYWNAADDDHVPCPYLADGSLNPQFRGVDFKGSTLQNNCLSDMNGMSNTKFIIDTLDKTHLDKTLMASTITNEQSVALDSESTSTFPAAICCQRYHSVLKPHSVSYSTSGSSTTITYGDWYLPSAGEAAYMIVNQGKIAYALTQINATHPHSAAGFDLSWLLWSSSECRYDKAWYLRPSDGNVLYFNKYGGYRVRAFAAF